MSSATFLNRQNVQQKIKDYYCRPSPRFGLRDNLFYFKHPRKIVTHLFIFFFIQLCQGIYMTKSIIIHPHFSILREKLQQRSKISLFYFSVVCGVISLHFE